MVEVWLYFALMRMGGPTYVSQSGYIAVIAGVLWASLFFDENITPWLTLSILLSLTALLVTGPREEAGKTANCQIKSELLQIKRTPSRLPDPLPPC